MANLGEGGKRIYKLVLTGGPCGGKTTGQARICTFFENMGWKVFRVPETATILVGGGVQFQYLTADEVYQFQQGLICTMMQIENTFFSMAESSNQDCLIICDRGVMDACAYMKPDQWERMKAENDWNEVDLRDNRYNHVIHMTTAAKGAEEFYRVDNHVARWEGLEEARARDDMTAQAWVGHPYYDIVDNETDFDRKVNKMIAANLWPLEYDLLLNSKIDEAKWRMNGNGLIGKMPEDLSVCNKLGLETTDCLSVDSRKRKFLIGKMPEDLTFPPYQDFCVQHDYLVTPNHNTQARIRKRGKDGNYTYTHTIRREEINNKCPELRTQISRREYELLMVQRDITHSTVHKTRRCFVWNGQYFQMDLFLDQCHERSRGLILLETYTCYKGSELRLPDFLDVIMEVTGNPEYSMFNLSRISATEPNISSLRSRIDHLSLTRNLSESVIEEYSRCKVKALKEIVVNKQCSIKTGIRSADLCKMSDCISNSDENLNIIKNCHSIEMTCGELGCCGIASACNNLETVSLKGINKTNNSAICDKTKRKKSYEDKLNSEEVSGNKNERIVRNSALKLVTHIVQS